MTDRLYPDMFPFWLQVQAACDHAKNATARLTGVELPIFDQTEQTFDGLKERIARTLEFVNGADPAAVRGRRRPHRHVHRPAARNAQMAGLDYFLNSGLPNFYFHLTTAYGILRHNGVETRQARLHRQSDRPRRLIPPPVRGDMASIFPSGHIEARHVDPPLACSSPSPLAAVAPAAPALAADDVVVFAAASLKNALDDVAAALPRTRPARR